LDQLYEDIGNILIMYEVRLQSIEKR